MLSQGFDYNLSVNIPPMWTKLLQDKHGEIEEMNPLICLSWRNDLCLECFPSQEQPDETWSVSRVVKNLQILCGMSSMPQLSVEFGTDSTAPLRKRRFKDSSAQPRRSHGSRCSVA